MPQISVLIELLSPHILALEKEVTTYSSILAWRIPWTEEPGRLQFMGSQRVGHNWATYHSSLTHSRIGMHPVVKLFLWSLVPHMGPWPFCFSPPNAANTRQCGVCLWLLFSDYRRHFGRMQRRQNWILNMRLCSLKAPWKISNQDHLTGFPVPSAPPHCWLDLAFFFFSLL